ncbi:unnamed protein product [Rotaria sp. Silwood2]|nr:unnamed protein product [Rotaria sp. Silwood2]CAF2618087.1 unnamed protein product [Rotaria sp. Silwood2]CAF3872929.1 unnamed protein product [Rotaria sp. Silwood2]CAF4072891.1 unnamed protein product [Rotaria sp. Silwood2]
MGKATEYHEFGMVIYDHGEYAGAIDYYLQSLEIKEKILSPTDADLSTSYTSVGAVCDKVGDHLNALSYLRKSTGNLPKDSSFKSS